MRITTTAGSAAILLALLVSASAAAAAPAAAQPPPDDRADFTLTILHNNDGESQLLEAPGQPDFGGSGRFATLQDELEAAESQPDPRSPGRAGNHSAAA